MTVISHMEIDDALWQMPLATRLRAFDDVDETFVKFASTLIIYEN